jgi:hypothetical protein
LAEGEDAADFFDSLGRRHAGTISDRAGDRQRRGGLRRGGLSPKRDCPSLGGRASCKSGQLPL